MSEIRETVGKIISDNWYKPDDAISVYELAQEGLRIYDQEMREAIDRGRKLNPGDFFIVTLPRSEVALRKPSIRTQFGIRLSCPTPTWDQNVYKYNRASDTLEFIWTVPDRRTCRFVKNNALNLPEDQKELIRFVFDFMDGTLDKKCAELNKEIKGY